MSEDKRIIVCEDNNIDELREKYPDGLSFVVGDTHGEIETLKALIDKIKFNPEKDHVYFVGDYDDGGNAKALLAYISRYYQADCSCPGFHLIRGNHERELCPIYPLHNLPDVIVVRRNAMNYYIAHAGMVSAGFEIINDDISKNPDKNVFAYRLDSASTAKNAPLRQITWSYYGLYSQKLHWHIWPSEEDLHRNKACIIHGHSPYCYFKEEDRFTYGDVNLFWQNQHIWFSEDLQSFNIDSNVKGRFKNGESYRGLACVCLEVLEEIASRNNGKLTVDSIRRGTNGVFSAEYRRCYDNFWYNDVDSTGINKIIHANLIIYDI